MLGVSLERSAIKSGLNVNTSFEEFLQVEDFLAAGRTLTDAEIIDNIRGTSEDENAEEHTEAIKVTAKGAEKVVVSLSVFSFFFENS